MTVQGIGNAHERHRAVDLPEISSGLKEFVVAAFAGCALLIAFVMLARHVPGMNYLGNDGALYQATVLAALKFGSLFDVNNISPVQGIGSQILPLNVWANPAFWPFALLPRATAAEISGLVAFGVLMVGCYAMMRCFDVPVVPSAVAAQLCIMLFAPAVVLLSMPSNFSLCPGNAVIYALQIAALGLLVRLEPGSWRDFGWITSGILVLLLYGVYSDPLWSMYNGIAWAVAFAVITFGSFNRRTIFIRCAAVLCCFALLLLSGTLEYLYTISRYTSRVWFAGNFDRVRGPELVSFLTLSPHLKTFYEACIIGWLLGLVTLHGRARLLVSAAVISAACYAAYSVVYLLVLNVPWTLPVPAYIEHSLFVLFLSGAVAGYWGALRAVALSGLRLVAAVRDRVALMGNAAAQPAGSRLVALVLGLAIAAVVPTLVANSALNEPNPYVNHPYVGAWVNEPELESFLAKEISLAVGQPFRGSTAFWTPGIDTDYTMANLWANGIPTTNEYSQLVTPQARYFQYAVLNKTPENDMNYFVLVPGSSQAVYWKTLQMMGVRYSVGFAPWPDDLHDGFRRVTVPYRPLGKEPGEWFLYELPRPNLGDYSPTQVVVAQLGAEMAAVMRDASFDFTRQVVLPVKPEQPLVPARDMRLSLMRGGGLHVSGRSDGTSLVMLPYQFSHCLRARDHRVRLVRANLLMTGMIFSGAVDTDIAFDYGLFSPACRRKDLADMKRLDMKIDFHMPHLLGDRLLPDWSGALERLRAATKVLHLDGF